MPDLCGENPLPSAANYSFIGTLRRPVRALSLGLGAVLLAGLAGCENGLDEPGLQVPTDKDGQIDASALQSKLREQSKKMQEEAAHRAKNDGSDPDWMKRAKKQSEEVRKQNRDSGYFPEAPHLNDSREAERMQSDLDKLLAKNKKNQPKPPSPEDEDRPRVVTRDKKGNLVEERLPQGSLIGVSDDGKSVKVLSKDDLNKKPSFWGRLMGKKDESAIKLTGLAGAAANAANTGSGGTPPGKHDSIVRRVDAEMQRMQVQQELDAREKEDAQKKAEALKTASAEVVDLDKPVKQADPDLITPTLTMEREGTKIPKPDPNQRPDPNLSEEGKLRIARENLEKRFAAGLKTNDMLERSWAFMLALSNNRTEAVPYMLKEMESAGPLRLQSAQCLGALGKGNSNVEDELQKGLADKDPLVRQACVNSLGGLQVERAVRPLLKLFKTEKNQLVRTAVCDALGQLGDKDAVPLLKERVLDKDEYDMVRARASLSLARLGDPSGKEYLSACMNSPLPQMQAMGLSGLCLLHDRSVPALLGGALESQYEEVWSMALQALSTMGPEAMPVLRQRIQAPNPLVRRRAALGLGMLGLSESLPYMEDALANGTELERTSAAMIVGYQKFRQAVPMLITLLKDPSTEVRRAVAASLVRLEAKDAIPALTDAARFVNGNSGAAAIRPDAPNPDEALFMLACVRALSGDQSDVQITRAPNLKNLRWPEFDQELLKHQVEVVKAYKISDVLSADGRAVGVVLLGPDGKELIKKEGEQVAAGFAIREIYLPLGNKPKTEDPAWVSLVRGETRVLLISGRPPEVSQLGKKHE